MALEEIVVKARPGVDIDAVRAKRKLRGDFGEGPPDEARSQFVSVVGSEYPIPDWLITEHYFEEEVGHIKSGKEGSVALVHRYTADASCLLARKRYVERKKRSFKNDQIYREGRRFTRESRITRAVENGTAYGHQIMTGNWFDTEFNAMRKLWLAGADVPYPVEFSGNGMLMQYIGDWDQAAPRLMDAPVAKDLADHLLEQILMNVRLFASEELVHGDLSPYNILVWDGSAWIIDLPQSVNLFNNPFGIDLLLRDITNVCNWFKKFGIVRDPSEELATVMADAYRT